MAELQSFCLYIPGICLYAKVPGIGTSEPLSIHQTPISSAAKGLYYKEITIPKERHPATELEIGLHPRLQILRSSYSRHERKRANAISVSN